MLSTFVDFPVLTGYVLGAGFLVWLATGSWVPLLAGGMVC